VAVKKKPKEPRVKNVGSEKDIAPTSPKKPPKKDTRFKKGQVANPKGRPKGAKSVSTELRKKIEGEAMTHLASAMPELISQAIEMAQKGNENMLKFVIERFIPKAAIIDDKTGKGFGGIIINVTSLDQVNAVKPDIEGEVDNDN
jgi:hypothetical protein